MHFVQKAGKFVSRCNIKPQAVSDILSQGVRAFSSEEGAEEKRNYIQDALEIVSQRDKTVLESESTMVALGQDPKIARDQAIKLRKASETAEVLKQGDRIKQLEENNRLLSEQLNKNNEALQKLTKKVGIYGKIIDSLSASRHGGQISFAEAEDKKSEEKNKQSKDGYIPYPLNR